jgi:hypothetical protein
MKSNQDENVKIDSCLVLVDKAINWRNYFSAYYTKVNWLGKKTLKNRLKIMQMIELRPQLMESSTWTFFWHRWKQNWSWKNYKLV